MAEKNLKCNKGRGKTLTKNATRAKSRGFELAVLLKAVREEAQVKTLIITKIIIIVMIMPIIIIIVIGPIIIMSSQTLSYP